MNQYDENFINNVKQLDNVVSVCFGKPKGAELPQVASPDDIVIDLVQRRTGKPLDLISAEVNNQVPPAG